MGPPATVRVRGTLALVAGSGESPRVYERFGRRISFDGYVVGVFEASAAADAARWLASQESAPRVLAGSDAGAAAVLAIASGGASADGVVVADFLPVGRTTVRRIPRSAQHARCTSGSSAPPTRAQPL